MLVFIDESGDAGFRLGEGSSPMFVAAMVIFETAEDAADTERLIQASEARRVHKGEFKFSRTRSDVRDLYFQTIAAGRFRVRAIVVRKQDIYSPHLRADKESFYEFFVKNMLRHDNGRLANARVVIDGSGDREFKRNLSAAIKQRVRDGAVRECRFSNSANDHLVQLADMCVGAIARSYRSDRDDKDRWRNFLRPRIDDVWLFR